ncbi:kinesin family member 3 [Pelomyxa schiedti]|nr:kinesin family member 3 [Pelomyxa schiedti]
MERIRVVLRVRPLEPDGGSNCVQFLTPNAVEVKGHFFTFDKCFDGRATQEEIYDDSAKSCIASVMEGYNATVFVYGQTASGKTYTMEGPAMDNEDLKGIVPRVVHDLFVAVHHAPAHMEVSVYTSFLEIYLERIRDLLDVKRDNLKVREEKIKGVYVEGQTELAVSTPEDVMAVLQIGHQNRATAETEMNPRSSRSHSVFMFTVKQRDRRDGTLSTGKLYLVDLAGSEKLGRSLVCGCTLKETQMINKSLAALGNVINSLTDGKSAHIPYRDSKLTRLLQESLGGNSKTTLIINCSPSILNMEETLSTLRFGQRAKTIKNKAKLNIERSSVELKAALFKSESEVERLNQVVASLQEELSVIKTGDFSDKNLALALPNVAELKKRGDLLEIKLNLAEEERNQALELQDALQDMLLEKEQEVEVAHKTLLEFKQQLEQSKQNESFKPNIELKQKLKEMTASLQQAQFESREKSVTIELLKTEIEKLKNELEKLSHSSNERSSLSFPDHLDGEQFLSIPTDTSTISDTLAPNVELEEHEDHLKGVLERGMNQIDQLYNTLQTPQDLSFLDFGMDSVVGDETTGSSSCSFDKETQTEKLVFEREPQTIPEFTNFPCSLPQVRPLDPTRTITMLPPLTYIPVAPPTLAGPVLSHETQTTISPNLDVVDHETRTEEKPPLSPQAIPLTHSRITDVSYDAPRDVKDLKENVPSGEETGTQISALPPDSGSRDLDLSSECDKSVEEASASQQSTSKEQELLAEIDLLKAELNTQLSHNTDLTKAITSYRDQLRLLQASSLQSSRNDSALIRKLENELVTVKQESQIQLVESTAIKNSLIKDLENRCLKVMDLEMQLSEVYEKYEKLRLSKSIKSTEDKLRGKIDALQRKLEHVSAEAKKAQIEAKKLALEHEDTSRALEAKEKHLLTLEKRAAKQDSSNVEAASQITTSPSPGALGVMEPIVNNTTSPASSTLPLSASTTPPPTTPRHYSSTSPLPTNIPTSSV